MVEELFLKTWKSLYSMRMYTQYKPEEVKYVKEFGSTKGIREYLKKQRKQNFAIDFVWYPATMKIAMEIDGAGFGHSGAGATRDRHKNNQLVLDGWKLLRYNAQEVKDHPHIICEEIAEFIERLK